MIANVSNSLRWLKNGNESDLKVLKGYREFQSKRKEDILKYSKRYKKGEKVNLASALDILNDYDLTDAFDDSQSNASTRNSDE